MVFKAALPFFLAAILMINSLPTAPARLGVLSTKGSPEGKDPIVKDETHKPVHKPSFHRGKKDGNILPVPKKHEARAEALVKPIMPGQTKPLPKETGTGNQPVPKSPLDKKNPSVVSNLTRLKRNLDSEPKDRFESREEAPSQTEVSLGKESQKGGPNKHSAEAPSGKGPLEGPKNEKPSPLPIESSASKDAPNHNRQVEGHLPTEHDEQYPSSYEGNGAEEKVSGSVSRGSDSQPTKPDGSGSQRPADKQEAPADVPKPYAKTPSDHDGPEDDKIDPLTDSNKHRRRFVKPESPYDRQGPEGSEENQDKPESQYGAQGPAVSKNKQDKPKDASTSKDTKPLGHLSESESE